MKKSEIYTIAALAVVRNCIVIGEVEKGDIDVLEELLLQRVYAQAAEFADNKPCDPVSFGDVAENVRSVFENIGNLFSGDRELRIGEAARPASIIQERCAECICARCKNTNCTDANCVGMPYSGMCDDAITECVSFVAPAADKDAGEDDPNDDIDPVGCTFFPGGADEDGGAV